MVLTWRKDTLASNFSFFVFARNDKVAVSFHWLDKVAMKNYRNDKQAIGLLAAESHEGGKFKILMRQVHSKRLHK